MPANWLLLLIKVSGGGSLAMALGAQRGNIRNISVIFNSVIHRTVL